MNQIFSQEVRVSWPGLGVCYPIAEGQGRNGQTRNRGDELGLFLAALGLHCCTAFLVAVSGGYSLVAFLGFSLQWLLLCRAWVLGLSGFSSYDTQTQQLWLQGSRAQAQQLWHMGLVAPQHVGSSQPRNQTHISCIGTGRFFTSEPPGKSNPLDFFSPLYQILTLSGFANLPAPSGSQPGL